MAGGFVWSKVEEAMKGKSGTFLLAFLFLLTKGRMPIAKPI